MDDCHFFKDKKVWQKVRNKIMKKTNEEWDNRVNAIKTSSAICQYFDKTKIEDTDEDFDGHLKIYAANLPQEEILSIIQIIRTKQIQIIIIIIKIVNLQKRIHPVGESNPGQPLDRRSILASILTGLFLVISPSRIIHL